MVLNLHRNHRLIRDAENGGKGVWRWVYNYCYTVTTRMTCIKMGSDESHFNVSLIVKDKVTRPCPQTTAFEEKGEPKRYRTEVLPLTSLPPYRSAKPALSVKGQLHPFFTQLLSCARSAEGRFFYSFCFWNGRENIEETEAQRTEV